MIYDTVIRGKFVDLKSITLEDEDVEFSYQIRKEEKNSKTVKEKEEKDWHTKTLFLR